MLHMNFETYTGKGKMEHIRLRKDAPEWLKSVEEELHEGDTEKREWITRTMYEACKAIDTLSPKFDAYWWAKTKAMSITEEELLSWLARANGSALLERADRNVMSWNSFESVLFAARAVYRQTLRIVADTILDCPRSKRVRAADGAHSGEQSTVAS